MKTNEITLEKIKKAEKIITKYIKNPFKEKMITYPKYDSVSDLTINRTVIAKVYNGYKCLDKRDTRLSIKDYDKRRYTVGRYKAVTLKYIQKFVCKEKFSLRLIHYVVFNLALKRHVQIMRCKDIKEIVMHTNPNWGGSSGPTLLSEYNYLKQYTSTYISNYNFVKNYLISNKLENSNSRLAISV